MCGEVSSKCIVAFAILKVGNTYCNKYKDYVCLMPNGELMKPGYLSHTFSKL